MNPKPGEVYFEVTAHPHDSAVNGEHWSTGTLPAAEVVRNLRDLADFIDRYWREPQECNCSATPEPAQATTEWVRNPYCVERWPQCGLTEPSYDPRCCRFPKSCSCWEPLEKQS